MPSPPERLVTAADLLVGVVLAAVLVGPAAVSGGLAGSGGAEVYGHAWVQAWAAEAWPAWPAGTALAEGAADWAVIDPLPTWIVAGLARVVGATAAWNAWAAAGVVLVAVGGGAFTRALGGVGIVGAVGVATMPIFLGSLTSGLTEDYALGLVALALAALLRDRRVLGGVLLGASAWCGLYLAWLGGLAAAAIGLRRLRSRPGRWLLAGLVATAIALPATLPFRERLAGTGHRSGTFVPRHEPLWRLDPWRGADLASFLAPGKVEVGDAFVREHPVYLGYTTLGLAALGGAHPAWLGVLACAAVAPGEHLSWAGTPLGVANPAMHVFRALPFAERFNHHARVMLLGQLILVGLAARGTGRIVGRFSGGRGGDHASAWGREPAEPQACGTVRPPRNAPPVATRWIAGVGGAAAVGIFAETALLSPARVPLPTAPTDTPAIYAALSAFPADLPVVVVGAAGPGVHPQRVFFDQRAHGRRLLHNPNRPADGRPVRGAIVVALGDAVPRVTAQRGPPDVTAADGAAWGPRE
ncbi:MAG: hypothetical protein ACK4YP_04640 [Myxococcota bacterium]